MTAMEMESNKASRNVLMGLRTEMCLTSELFHVKRSTKVDTRITRTKSRISVSASTGRRVWATSLIIIIHMNIFFPGVL